MNNDVTPHEKISNYMCDTRRENKNYIVLENHCNKIFENTDKINSKLNSEPLR